MSKTKTRIPRYITLKVTPKEWDAIQASVDSLTAMSGTPDPDFNAECKAGDKALKAITKRNPHAK